MTPIGVGTPRRTTPPDPPQLYDLDADPHELENLALLSDHADVWADFERRFAARWDLAAFDQAVRASQRRRHIVDEELRQETCTPWDFQPHEPASRRYMRNDMDLNVLESERRYPRGQ
jgi:choline-sulfatase